MKTRSKPQKKNPNDYPRVTLRVPGDLLISVNAIRKQFNVSQAEVFIHCVRRHLAHLNLEKGE